MIRIALVGNPNAGKSTLFNRLTGLKQKIGNFPGVTVEKKTGTCDIGEGLKAEIVDLPGTYSLYPKSLDEQVAVEVLTNQNSPYKPDLILLVADASNLKRHLLLFTQIRDLGLPVVLVLNFADEAESKGIHINLDKLQEMFQVDVTLLNARTGEHLSNLKKIIARHIQKRKEADDTYFINPVFFNPQLIEEVKEAFNLQNNYLAFQYIQQFDKVKFLNESEKSLLSELIQKYRFNPTTFKSKETLARYEIIQDFLNDAIVEQSPIQQKSSISDRIDRVLLHQFWGYAIFFTILLLIFQAIYSWATYPMDWIEAGFAYLQEASSTYLPKGVLTDLFVDGILAGIAGIVVFVPQIAILFAFIAILEESGYMSRVMFLMDKVMRNFGLNGRSVVPLISGIACAVPAIMATRNIEHWKERLITIFVTPLMSCSARLPVYAILIALVVPEQKVLGIFDLRGLTLFGMYFLGLAMALVSAWVMKLILRTKDKSFLIMELPTYKFPNWYNVCYTLFDKVKVFVLEAGKIILAISIILWVLSSYGPKKAMQEAKMKAEKAYSEDPSINLEDRMASLKLEASYAGQFGKLIEPVLLPIGYDWKIGIALITSFAAREVFVGTLSTIYSVGQQDESQNTLRQKMKAEINPRTQKPMYTMAVGFSLLVFYAFAMQCMSTLAIVYRETKSWKWPTIQFLYLTSLAYLSSLLVYNLLS